MSLNYSNCQKRNLKPAPSAPYQRRQPGSTQPEQLIEAILTKGPLSSPGVAGNSLSARSGGTPFPSLSFLVRVNELGSK